MAASCFLNFLDLCFFFLSPMLPSAAAAADSASTLALKCTVNLFQVTSNLLYFCKFGSLPVPVADLHEDDDESQEGLPARLHLRRPSETIRVFGYNMIRNLSCNGETVILTYDSSSDGCMARMKLSAMNSSMISFTPYPKWRRP